MKNKIIATKNYLVNFGVKTTVKEILIQVGLMKRKRHDMTTFAKAKDIIAADFINKPYKRPGKINKNILDIGFVSPPIGRGGGGHLNITRFANYLIGGGHKVTMYVYSGPLKQDPDDAKMILKKHYNLDIEVKSVDEYKKEDVVFATSWETAYPVFNLKTEAHKMYFVQDFEPYFFPASSHYIFAENTYRFGFFGLCAGGWLPKKLAEYGMRSDHYDFSVDADLYRPKGKIDKKKKILFYAQPSKGRRAFELGVISLGIFKSKHPDYEIDFVGENIDNINIPFEFNNLKNLPLDKLPELYHEFPVCLVLSLTNVSLLPLELLASGCVPILNNGENNTLVLGDNDDIIFTDLTPTGIANSIEKVISIKDINKHAKMISEKISNSSWNDEYEKAEQIILREVTK